MIHEAPFYVQHELFPLDHLEPEPATVCAQHPKGRKSDAVPPPDDPAIEETPDIGVSPLPHLVIGDGPPTAARSPESIGSRTDGVGSLPMVVKYPLPQEIASVAPIARTFSLGTFAAGMSAMSLLLAVIALGVGIHASRARSQHVGSADEDVVLAELAGVAAGVGPSSVAVDAGHKRLQARAVRIPGAELSTYQALEQRVQAQAPGWTVTITPPLQPVPLIRFADGQDGLSAGAKRAVQASVWAARRWGFSMIGVPGLIEPQPRHPLLPQRRAQAVASLLDQMGVQATPLSAEGQSFRLHLPWPEQK